MLLAFLITFLVGSIVALLFALDALINLFRFKVPYVTTSRWAIDWLQQHLTLTEKDIVYDIGCGDARVLLVLARKFPQAKFIGIENQWWPYLLAKWGARNLPSVTIRKQNFYQASLSDATIIFCFLIDGIMAKVGKKLQGELRPGTKVFSYGFRFPAWEQAESIINPKRPQGSELRVYQA